MIITSNKGPNIIDTYIMTSVGLIQYTERLANGSQWLDDEIK